MFNINQINISETHQNQHHMSNFDRFKYLLHKASTNLKKLLLITSSTHIERAVLVTEK